MKYIILVPDGVADEPLKELDGKTPLEFASTPNMDLMAQQGLSGLVRIIPPGMLPGSDVGNISVLGYDATKGFSGRSPLEAANLGILLKEDELAFRCNLVTIINNKMVDYSAGHISIAEADLIMKDIIKEFSDDTVRFVTGKSYRHIAVIKTSDLKPFLATKCTPPHDIMDSPVVAFLPQGPMAGFLSSYAGRINKLLAAHPVNKTRISQGLLPANAVWFWGQGGKPDLQMFRDRYGMDGSIISAVDLVNGIGRLIGLDIIFVPGATGYYDTNYKGKAEFGLASLNDKDFVYIHVEATDEAGHNGDIKAKVDCVEKFDRLVVGTVLEYCRNNPDTRVLVTPDHPTPLAKRTHTNAPVPFVMMGKNIERNGLDGYNERSAATVGVRFDSGVDMINYFMTVNKG
ncbi:MAG: cofactor-independent phosphoglycerate mutase [Candidatus Omnitrophica bacterium]|nr:cofactor-independent phosphoglycerate mutase [Candidatus Omnitrophota bacterium]